MRDLQLQRMINIAAAGVVLIGVTGCANYKKKAARKVCKAMKSCDKDYFEEEYSSMSDCVDQFTEYLQEAEDDYGKDCAKAYAEVMKCYASEYKKTCGDDEDEEYDYFDMTCAKEWAKVYDHCDYDGDDDEYY